MISKSIKRNVGGDRGRCAGAGEAQQLESHKSRLPVAQTANRVPGATGGGGGGGGEGWLPSPKAEPEVCLSLSH